MIEIELSLLRSEAVEVDEDTVESLLIPSTLEARVTSGAWSLGPSLIGKAGAANVMDWVAELGGREGGGGVSFAGTGGFSESRFLASPSESAFAPFDLSCFWLSSGGGGGGFESNSSDFAARSADLRNVKTV